MNKMTFKLFANCKIVIGAKNASICDLQRGNIYSIPKELGAFLLKSKNKKTLRFIEDKFKNDKETILEYLAYLEKNEIGFWTDEPERFPELNTEWKSPEQINNAIIELEKLEENEIIKIVVALKNLLCKHIELRFYKNNSLDRIDLFMRLSINSTIRSVIIYIPYSSSLILNNANDLIVKYPQISFIILHSCDKIDLIKNLNPKIKLTSRKIDSRHHCGTIDPKLFSIKLPVFMESLKFNSCLNKKLSIDINGDIKNCPSMPKSYGNIKTDDIETTASSNVFKKSWSIHKDLISTCKDCEFKYVCTDCRAYLEDPKNQLSKPLKCGYDPYKGVWENWSKNPLKQKVKEYYHIEL